MSVIVAMLVSEEVVWSLEVLVGHGTISSTAQEYVTCTSIVDVRLRGLRLRSRGPWCCSLTTMDVIQFARASSVLLCDRAEADPELDMATGF